MEKASRGLCSKGGKGTLLITTSKNTPGARERHFKSTDHHDQAEISLGGGECC